MKQILIGLLVSILFMACSNHGTKVAIKGTKGEVLYKGDGVSEADAKKLGEFLKEEEYFNDKTDKSVQLRKAKNGDEYDVHFVVDEKKIKETPGIENSFLLMGIAISASVFDGKPVNVYLADENLKDFTTLSFDKKKASELKAEESSDDKVTSLKDWEKEEAGGVNFYWKGISDEESKKIADFIVESKDFEGGTAELFVTKEGDRYVISFPMIESARNNPTYHDEVAKVTKKIKDNVFPNDPFTFHVTDETLKAVKSWEY